MKMVDISHIYNGLNALGKAFLWSVGQAIDARPYLVTQHLCDA